MDTLRLLLAAPFFVLARALGRTEDWLDVAGEAVLGKQEPPPGLFGDDDD